MAIKLILIDLQTGKEVKPGAIVEWRSDSSQSIQKGDRGKLIEIRDPDPGSAMMIYVKWWASKSPNESGWYYPIHFGLGFIQSKER